MSPSTFLPGLVGPDPAPEDALLFVARGLEVLVTEPGSPRRLPMLVEARALAERLHFLGTLEGRAAYAAALREGEGPPPGFVWAPARSLFGQVGEAEFAAAGRAIAIAEWDLTHRFCGRCGAPTELLTSERAQRCPRCALVFYPRIAPAVICLVEREGGEALLAHGRGFQPGRYSTLAGFVEPGESLEEAIHREVMEEVGVTLGGLRYFGSQPWPFGRSLMVGFTARHTGGEIRIDAKEILDARWFRPDALPDFPPKMSIAHALISDWVRRVAGGAGEPPSFSR